MRAGKQSGEDRAGGGDPQYNGERPGHGLSGNFGARSRIYMVTMKRR